MSSVIHLDHVVRETLSHPYRDLVTRPTGAAVRRRVMSVLEGFDERDAFLDFSEIGVLDFSCADEVVAKLLTQADALPVTRVLLLGLTDDHVDAIEQVLGRQGLVVVAICSGSDTPRILGDVPDDDRRVFDLLVTMGRSTAAPVADRLEWPVQRVHRALQALAGRRCVLSHPDATYELGAVA